MPEVSHPPLLVPSALIHGDRAACMVEDGRARWLAGGPTAFTAVELREGDDAGAVLGIEDAIERTEFRDTLDRIAAPRAPFIP